MCVLEKSAQTKLSEMRLLCFRERAREEERDMREKHREGRERVGPHSQRKRASGEREIS